MRPQSTGPASKASGGGYESQGRHPVSQLIVWAPINLEWRLDTERPGDVIGRCRDLELRFARREYSQVSSARSPREIEKPRETTGVNT